MMIHVNLVAAAINFVAMLYCEVAEVHSLAILNAVMMAINIAVGYLSFNGGIS